MDLICYKYDGWQPRIRAGTPRRQWMDATNERYAYRCLPLTIANSHGWELLSPVAFEAKWDGGEHMEAVEIRMDPGYAPHLKPVSLFGYGTITWHVEGIFRTPPGWNLFVSGPPNRQKDAIQALGGIIETDWSPYTFTMNWRFTRADHWVRFEENEPIAFFFPVERGRAERFVPKLARLEDKPELRAAFEKWSESRNAFQKWVLEANPEAPADKWQKLYFRGLDSDGSPGPADHQSKLRLAPFRFPDGKVMDPPEMRACPVRHRPEPVSAPEPPPFNALLNPAGAAGTPPPADPALALALGRIGFDAAPAEAAAGPPRGAGQDRATALALKRRDWLLDVQEQQRQLSSAAAQIDRVRGLSGQDFLDAYYAPGRPVVIEGAMTDWPALERWTPDHLADLIGAAEIEYQGDRDGAADFDVFKARHRRAMPFDRFIAAITPSAFGNDRYITGANAAANRAALAPLWAETGPLDDYLLPGAPMAWIGPAGTFTPLHFDLANHLIAQAAGAKHFILLPPSETQRLYPHSNLLSAVHDLTDETQLARHPLARGARSYEVDLQAGELLFVPIGWWQQATALDFSVTLTYTHFRWSNEGGRDFPRD